MAQVIVPASSKQQKDFKDIVYGEKSYKDKFLKNLKKIQQEFTENHAPYCYICAKQDWEDVLSRAQIEYMRMGRDHEGETKVPEIDVGDLYKYGELSYFEAIDEKPINEVTIIEGIKVPRRAYMRYEFRCKLRRHGMTVDMPWYAYEEKKKASKDKKLKKGDAPKDA